MSLMLRCGKCGDAKRFQIDVTVQYSTANVCRYFIADSVSPFVSCRFVVFRFYVNFLNKKATKHD